MKVVISGGGTGGHIYPAVAIIEELKKRDNNIDILYIGSKNSMESELIPSLEINYESIEVMGLPRKINKKFFKSIFVLLKGLRQAKKILKRFKPDVVIGTGGFVTGPVLYKAHKMGIYTIFHEQNSYPGITNRILSRYVNAMAVTFKESIKFFKNNDKCVVTGNPIRNRFEFLNREQSLKFFEIDENSKNIFSFGGSNGSEELNKAVLGILDKFCENEKISLIHVTGKLNYDKFLEEIKNKDIKIGNNVKILPYMTEMDKAYGVSDLVITSSGAITLAEISKIGLASILIPKAYTTENHQEFNARAYKDIGASELILEKELNSDLLWENIEKIIFDNSRLEQMKENAKKLATPNAVKDFVSIFYDEFKGR
ncbi:undecaprenyldiphospho-muramoylpentapeptide beta-N-acetylglucosaminyltransferase [uncultured Parvimonas sp.]|uniref:undecaprenyldiphospho-muramoylpentapeptide beta-N-acetylglucosaminyltransferase n=1 Tax=Parvimonas parva TaxID=2769485 RepID=UPI00061D641A|nr:undecaprenyldiphospho-muramoylpentapeptide beta-N-acetylglucosaminyltransferase [uncultured Parvimonas sp.]